MTDVLGVPGPDPSLSAGATDLWLSGRCARRPIEARFSARPMEGVSDDGFEVARGRLLGAVAAAQDAMAEAMDAAAEYDALRPAEAWPVEGSVMLAWLAYRVSVAYSGPGDRLAAHLRYFAGQRFFDERPDDLFAGLARPRERRGLARKPP